MVFYFTGTGNSLYIAKQLDENAVSIPQKAIGLAMPEVNPDARYRNEHVSLRELIDANNRN